MLKTLSDRYNIPEWVLGTGLGSASGTLISYIIYKKWKSYSTKKYIKDRGDRAAAECRTLKEKTETAKIDPALEQKVLKFSVTELQQALKSGEVKAADVLLIYQKKAMEVDGALNCVTEPIKDAEVLATKCDEDREKKGLLHGIPISVKENYQIQGYDSTLGIKQNIDVLAKEDCVLIKVLKSQGGIPFVRTNLPQTMLSYDNSNPIYGNTLNPHNVTRTPGGSSGGEGALIGGKGSIIGLGNDIAGSIRIPCQFCGVYGLKPTIGRLSTKGSKNLTGGQTVVRGTSGPMARNMDGIILLMKAMLVPLQFQLDPEIVPIPFRNEIFEDKKPLKIGYYTFDGCTVAVPACERAVMLAKDALEKQGHQVIEFNPPNVMHAVSYLYFKTMSGDGVETILEALNGDVVDPAISTMVKTSSLPYWLRKCLSYVLGWTLNDVLLQQCLYSMTGCKSVKDWWKFTKEVQEYRWKFAEEWNAAGIDAVICPGFAFPAPPCWKYDTTWGGATYTPLYNLLNYPAGSVPITTVSKADLDEMKKYPTETYFQKGIKQAQIGSERLPVGVQVVGLPWQEELVLRVMKDIDDEVKYQS